MAVNLLGKTDTFVNVLQCSFQNDQNTSSLLFSTPNPINTGMIQGLTPKELHEACRYPASAQKTSSVAGVSPSSSYQKTKCHATQRMNMCVCVTSSHGLEIEHLRILVRVLPDVKVTM